MKLGIQGTVFKQCYSKTVLSSDKGLTVGAQCATRVTVWVSWGGKKGSKCKWGKFKLCKGSEVLALVPVLGGMVVVILEHQVTSLNLCAFPLHPSFMTLFTLSMKFFIFYEGHLLTMRYGREIHRSSLEQSSADGEYSWFNLEIGCFSVERSGDTIFDTSTAYAWVVTQKLDQCQNFGDPPPP